jgi:putative DNA primase/helicase
LIEATAVPIAPPKFDAIPRDLTSRPQWVVWREEQPAGRDKPTKPPYDPRTGLHADVSDPATWSAFDEARAAYERGGYDGVGYVLTADDSLVGWDLDGCRDATTGIIDEAAERFITLLDSYSEVSPSGEGVRIFTRGTLPPGGNRKRNIEVYDRGRYLTVTGWRVGDAVDIEERSEEIASVHAAIFGEAPALPDHYATPADRVLDDAVLIEQAKRAADGKKFSSLWAGDTSGYDSASEADLALCRLLAFWTQRDAGHVDRLFRQSRLMRTKWDERHGESTYGQLTIARAVETCAEMYGSRVTEPEPMTDAITTVFPLGEPIDAFLSRPLPDAQPFIADILSDEGGGWIAGEEKLGKTLYALHEALALALGRPVCGRFSVPQRRRVLFVEEEDSPRRARRRLRALLRGHDVDPDDGGMMRELGTWFQLSVWDGFTLDDKASVARLDAALAAFKPEIVYLDALRKLTLHDLNKQTEASAILATLDRLRRQHGCLFRVLHHFRKSQGRGRGGRGSQEISGSFVLGAWGESSLFFEPMGRKPGEARVEIQTKDGAPAAPFKLRIESEGPAHAPEVLRLVAEELAPKAELRDTILALLPTLPTTEAEAGQPGVSLKTIIDAVGKSDKTVRNVLKELQALDRVQVVGAATKQAQLFAVAAA